jgi:hypothetical protein
MTGLPPLAADPEPAADRSSREAIAAPTATTSTNRLSHRHRRRHALRFASAMSGSSEKGSRGTCSVIEPLLLASPHSVKHVSVAHSVGGASWRIRSGLITTPGAVKVTDLTTGRSADVVDGDLFILAVEAPNPAVAPYKSPRLHLVAYDEPENVVASDCRNCSGG